ncbi:MAG: iron-sulfur cluster repair di-iron protein [Planctomycetota bacterium]|jgi:regulator of cell morphogenesis and NO signaling
MTITSETTVGSVATEHPLATRVFARHGIDFCCGGGKPLREACAAQGVDTDLVLAELTKELSDTTQTETRWDEAPLTDLIDHIVNTYHHSLREELPRLEAMARKVNQVHGEKDPERLQGILDTLLALKSELTMHMRKEEEILFPMIAAGQGASAMGPVSVMEAEHADAGNMLRRLSELTDQYTAPEGACNTWRGLWAGLEDLERQLHTHIHLENNILFPRALAS